MAPGERTAAAAAALARDARFRGSFLRIHTYVYIRIRNAKRERQVYTAYICAHISRGGSESRVHQQQFLRAPRAKGARRCAESLYIARAHLFAEATKKEPHTGKTNFAVERARARGKRYIHTTTFARAIRSAPRNLIYCLLQQNAPEMSHFSRKV